MDSLNDLISMAASILDSGFDLNAFLAWKSMAFLALVGLLGPAHYYSQKFQDVAEPSPLGLLAGGGILSAAKEELSAKGADELS